MGALIPSPVAVGVRRRVTPSQVDRYGADVESWAAPVAAAARSVVAAESSEPDLPNRDAVVVLVTVISDGPICGQRDRLVWPFPGGDEYQVEGVPADYRHGPWPNPAAGVVTTGRRVDG